MLTPMCLLSVSVLYCFYLYVSVVLYYGYGSIFLLDLRWNNIGILGGRAFVNLLAFNKTLSRLELAGNNVPDDILNTIGIFYVMFGQCFAESVVNYLFYKHFTLIVLQFGVLGSIH